MNRSNPARPGLPVVWIKKQFDVHCSLCHCAVSWKSKFLRTVVGESGFVTHPCHHVVVFVRLTTARASLRGPARLDERPRAAPAPDARLETLKDRTQRAHTQDHTHTYGYYLCETFDNDHVHDMTCMDTHLCTRVYLCCSRCEQQRSPSYTTWAEQVTQCCEIFS